jgi:hypothetical protein
MDSSSPSVDIPPAQSGSVMRLFHFWCLPVLWWAPVLVLWFIVWVTNQHGDSNMVLLFAGFPGIWLAGLISPSLSGVSMFLDALAQCFGGLLVMGMIGLFQDMLHVPKRIVVFYVMAALVSFTSLHILLGMRASDLKLSGYLQLMLMDFCIGLYIFAPASCIVYLFPFIGRKLARVP